MATIQFQNGKSVQFEGTPTPEDVDFVAKQIGVTQDSTAAPSAPAAPSTSLFDKTIPPVASAAPGDSPLAAGTKTLANLIPSAANTAIGLAEMPFKGLAHLKDLPGAAYNLVKEQGPLAAAGNFIGGAYDTLVPSSGQDFINALLNKTGISNLLPETAKSYLAPKGTGQALSDAQVALTNDPVGQILPYMLLGRDAAYKISPEAGTAFDSAVSKVAKPITASGDLLGGILKKAVSAPGDAAGAAGKFVTSQATGLPYKTVGELVDHPGDYTTENRNTVNRQSVTGEIKDALDQKIKDLSDTGKEYQNIHNMNTIDTSVSPETTKTIREGGQTLQYNLVDAPDEKLSVPELRQKASILEKDPTTPGDVLHATHAALAEKELSQTIPHTVTVSPNYIDRLIKENTGLDIKDGKVTGSLASEVRDPKDIRAVQNLYDKAKPSFSKGKLTTSEFLHFRSDLADMAHYEREITKSDTLDNLADIMRGKFNAKYRSQIPGLEALDHEISPKFKEVKELRKGLLDGNGNLTKNAENMVSNATNKGRTAMLDQLEKIKPGITRKIEIMRTIENIESARENKPGTYARTALGPGGILAGLTTMNLPLVVAAIGETILSSPSVAVPLLRAYGFSKEITGGVITYLKNAAESVNQIPNTGISSFIPSKVQSLLQTDTKDIPMGLSIKDVSKDTSGVYNGEKDLTTTILSKLEGRSTVSKQFISDLTNSGDLKQVERDMVRNVLETEKGDTVNVADFAKKVKDELLPLKVNSSDVYNGKTNDPDGMVEEGNFTPKYENVSLSPDIRGKVAEYKENIYESPIKTSAGDVHFNYQSKNYFGHTRIEDMADNTTRRVIEVQSDLYQKGNLEKETKNRVRRANEDIPYNTSKETGAEIDAKFKEAENKAQKEVNQLHQYNDPTAHFRMVREEIQKAAQDGKTSLQFPTGETAMKIEGLGQADNTRWRTAGNGHILKSDELKVGQEINSNGQSNWIITDVLGDGKFKAVPKNTYDKFVKYAQEKGIDPLKELQTGRPLTDSETFDISGKVDTNNPIYKFYEKDLGKYLKNKFNAKPVVDDKGVKWMQVDIKPDMKNKPVNAFSMIQGKSGRSLNMA